MCVTLILGAGTIRILAANGSIDKPPNLEYATATAFLSAILFKNHFSTLTPLVSIVISDIFIGVSSISLFVWSAWVMIGFCCKSSACKAVISPIRTGVLLASYSSLIFYLWTNFGVWLVSAGRWYSFDIHGLIYCLLSGLPFFRNMIFNNIIILPVVALVAKRIESRRLFFMSSIREQGLKFRYGCNNLLYSCLGRR